VHHVGILYDHTRLHYTETVLSRLVLPSSGQSAHSLRGNPVSIWEPCVSETQITNAPIWERKAIAC